MKVIDIDLLNQVSEKAKTSTRSRMNYNFHSSPDDVLQRMLNAIQPNSYARPHRHLNPPKAEIFIALKGEFAVFTYSDNGEILKYQIISPKKEQLGVEIPIGVYHNIISLKENSVVYEIKHGPYNSAEDKEFPEWAPFENTPEAEIFLIKLKSAISHKKYKAGN